MVGDLLCQVSAIRCMNDSLHWRKLEEGGSEAKMPSRSLMCPEAIVCQPVRVSSRGNCQAAT